MNPQLINEVHQTNLKVASLIKDHVLGRKLLTAIEVMELKNEIDEQTERMGLWLLENIEDPNCLLDLHSVLQEITPCSMPSPKGTKENLLSLTKALREVVL
jgi:hypothetical protein